MARLKKKHFDGFEIASYRLTDAEQSGAGVKIISQRATKRFRLQIGTEFAVCTLVLEYTLIPLRSSGEIVVRPQVSSEVGFAFAHISAAGPEVHADMQLRATNSLLPATG